MPLKEDDMHRQVGDLTKIRWSVGLKITEISRTREMGNQ
jgi:hypothetical protein